MQYYKTFQPTFSSKYILNKILFFVHSNEINSLNFSLQSAGYNASFSFARCKLLLYKYSKTTPLDIYYDINRASDEWKFQINFPSLPHRENKQILKNSTNSTNSNHLFVPKKRYQTAVKKNLKIKIRFKFF